MEDQSYELVNFGAAVIALEQGKRVARFGWNGKGLYIFKQVPAEIGVVETVPKMQSLPSTVKQSIAHRLGAGIKEFPAVDPIEFNSIKYKNQMCIMYPDNTLYGYTPSTSDALAEDWMVLDTDIRIEDIASEPSGPEFLTFGQAIEKLKEGNKILRSGWNGSEMFLYYVPAASYPAITSIAKTAYPTGLVPYREYIAIKTAQGDVATWSPSNSDVFEKDWIYMSVEAAEIADTSFIDRLIVEHDELKDKAQKLTVFISSPGFNNIEQAQQTLLRSQLVHMDAYVGVLSARLIDLTK